MYVLPKDKQVAKSVKIICCKKSNLFHDNKFVIAGNAVFKGILGLEQNLVASIFMSPEISAVLLIRPFPHSRHFLLIFDNKEHQFLRNLQTGNYCSGC